MRFSKPIQVAMFVTLLLLIIFLYTKISHLFVPMVSVIQLVIVPLLLSVFCYYLLRPVVSIMRKYKINRIISILVLFLIIFALLIWVIVAIIPMLQRQTISLINNAPAFFNSLGTRVMELQENELIRSIFPNLNFQWSSVSSYIEQALVSVNSYLGGVFSFISDFTIILFTTPIILFFMLKESEKLPLRIVNATPDRFKVDMKEMLTDFDRVLNSFIVGRVLVNLALGVLMYIGFVIIDLPYALLLTTVAVIANFVPFVGAILSSIPIVLVGLVNSPATAIWALVIILAAQQIQDNLIAPYIFGKQLNIHPLTTIILVLGAGKIGGIIAMIVVIPVYLLIKITSIKVYKLFIKDRWEKL